MLAAKGTEIGINDRTCPVSEARFTLIYGSKRGVVKRLLRHGQCKSSCGSPQTLNIGEMTKKISKT
jgi:hypothetical protein